MAALAAIADVRPAIGFSSFAVLTYYAVANASAWTLSEKALSWTRVLAAIGFVGCAALALALPYSSVIGGASVLALGSVIRALWRVKERNRTRSDA